MAVRRREYEPERDFVRVRDFLAHTYRAFGRLLNWRIERWNYARYFVAPMLGAFGQAEHRIEDSLQAIRFWEETVGLWENDAGEIVGVVNMEHPDRDHPGFGEAFVQRHPQYVFLLDEMLNYAQATLANEKTNSLHIYVYDDDAPLQTLLQRRGYEPNVQDVGYDSEFVVGRRPEVELPAGYVLQSMAQENNIELRREIFGRAFNHPEPAEWPSAFSYQELQRAPDYRPDQDLYIVGPDGRYVSCCIVWYDALNRLGILEPVGTHPDFRQMGLGKAVVLAGIGRAAALGAEKVCVGSGQRFYEAIGFEKKYIAYRWARKL
jgi:predicted N-acetyltransferase YhbS